MKKILIFISMYTFPHLYAQQSLKVIVDEDIIGKFHFSKAGLLKSEIVYDLLNKKNDTIYYTYKASKLEDVRIAGNGNVIGMSKEGIIKSFQDLHYHIKLLSKLKIIVPIPEANKDIVNGIANIFALTGRYQEKQEGKKRIIFIDSLCTNTQFYPSEIKGLVPQNTVLESYELILENNTVQHETYVTNSAILYRSYFYKKKRLTMIVSEGRYAKHGESLSIKGFIR